jgi:hypothetical protein
LRAAGTPAEAKLSASKPAAIVKMIETIPFRPRAPFLVRNRFSNRTILRAPLRPRSS